MRLPPPTTEQMGVSVPDPADTCSVCKVDLRTQPHNLEPHRQAAGLNRPVEEESYRNLDAEIEKSMTRHPAGSRLPGAHRNGN